MHFVYIKSSPTCAQHEQPHYSQNEGSKAANYQPEQATDLSIESSKVHFFINLMHLC